MPDEPNKAKAALKHASNLEQALQKHHGKGGSDRLLRAHRARNRAVHDRAYLEVLRQNSQLDCPFPFPRTEEYETLAQGSFSIGRIGFHGEELRINPLELNKGMCVVGASRMGKTWFLTRLAQHLHQIQGVSVFIPDIKEDYTKLTSQGFLYTQLRELPFNVLEHVPGTDIESHCWEIGRQLSSAWFLLNSGTILSRTLLSMFRANGQPTLNEYKTRIHELKPGKETGLRNDQAIPLHGRIEQLCTVVGETACNTRHGFRPHQHQNQSIVISLGLGDKHTHALFTTWLDYWLYAYNKAHNIRPNRLTNAIIVDEASFLFRHTPEHPPYINELCALHGEFGNALIAATQLRFSTEFQANTAWKVLLPVGDATLFKHQAEAMGLTQEQILWAEKNLGVGNAIVSTPIHNEPLLTALQPLQQTTTKEQQAQESNNALIQLIDTYAKQQNTINLQHPKQPQPTQSSMMPNATKLLRHLATNPLTPITKAYKSTELSMEQGNTAKNFLEQNDLIQCEPCRLYKGRGRQPIIAQPAQKGIQYLQIHYPEIHVVTLEGKGGIEHKVHTHLIAQHYQANGYIVKKEYREADIAIQQPNEQTWTAIEIANSNNTTAHLNKRIQNNTQAGALKTIIVCSNTQTTKKLQKTLEHNNKAEVIDVEQFLLDRNTTTQVKLIE